MSKVKRQSGIISSIRAHTMSCHVSHQQFLLSSGSKGPITLLHRSLWIRSFGGGHFCYAFLWIIVNIAAFKHESTHVCDVNMFLILN